MNIGAIVVTVRAHDARNAAYRLALPVSDPTAAGPESIWPGGSGGNRATMTALGHDRQQLTPALLGVG
jgi:hypothetical protein